MTAEKTAYYQFDGYRLDISGRVLHGPQNEVIDLTPKAIEILCALVENAGRVVSKEELLKQVWPDSFVEEANLSHHIFKLRKALGEEKDIS